MDTQSIIIKDKKLSGIITRFLKTINEHGVEAHLAITYENGGKALDIRLSGVDFAVEKKSDSGA